MLPIAGNLCFLVFLLCLPCVVSAQQTGTATIPRKAATASVPPSAATIAPSTPEEFFARARQLSDLEAAGIPFHLKASYVASKSGGMFGDAEFAGAGTFEIWWVSKESSRSENTLDGYHWVFIRNGKAAHVYGTSNYVPLRLRQANHAVLIRLSDDEASSPQLEMAHAKLSGVDLTVITREHTVQPNRIIPVLTQDYFTSQGILRIHREGILVTFYNRFEPFENHMVPRSMELALGPNRLLNISIDTLEPFAAGENGAPILTAAPTNLSGAGRNIRASSKTAASRVVEMAAPEYPAIAKAAREQGTVVIQTTIDEDGRVREPFIISSPGSMLNGSALAAVRKWRYRPVVFDGTPVNVDTTISVVYSLRTR